MDPRDYTERRYPYRLLHNDSSSHRTHWSGLSSDSEDHRDRFGRKTQKEDMGEYPRDEVYMDKIRDIIGIDMGGRSLEPAQLLPFMYLGSQRNAESLRLLRKLGITHVLNCAGFKGPRELPFPERSPYEGLHIDYYEFKAEDHDYYDITQHFREAFNYLDKVKSKGGVCLVHCALGINRSTATCAAYLMVNSKMTLLKAIQHIRSRRRVILSNAGFRRQLIRFARMKNMLDPIPQEQYTRSAPKSTPMDELYMSFTNNCFSDKLGNTGRTYLESRVDRDDPGDRRSSRSTATTYSSGSIHTATTLSDTGRDPQSKNDRLPGDYALSFLYDKFMSRSKV